MDKSEKTILIVIIGVVVGCGCLALLCGGVVMLYNRILPASPMEIPIEPTVATTEPAEVIEATPSVLIPTQVNPEGLEDSEDTLLILESAEIPIADLVVIAERFEGKLNIPRQLTTSPVEYQVGDQKYFYALNVDTNEITSLLATLQYETHEVYFWIEEDAYFDKEKLKEVVEKFSSEIYPTNQEFFGTEWMPGVDNDPHLFILYAGDLGENLAGYNSASDTVLPQADENSNIHEMFYINADVQALDDPYTLSVMAHEFQHLIHGYHDTNEELWLNEGFSELATLLNGYDAGGFDFVFAFNPDVQLNDWSTDASENTAHYGASFLYTTYLLDRFGEEITKQVVGNEGNGFSSIDQVFKENALTDGITGLPITADDFFMDWAIANYLMDPLVEDGRYAYHNYADAPRFSASETAYSCADEVISRDVKQYGIEYIALDCPGETVQLQFTGSTDVPVLPVTDPDGRFVWSNRADSSITSLRQEFDFSGISGPISLSYQTWYDIEVDYDYVYLLAASESGDQPELLITPSCSSIDLNGNNFGCGYNGSSEGWRKETIDLSRFAGQKVTLSFEYVTDEAVTGEGFVLDNLSIPQLGYACDFEEDNCGWDSQGFVRIANSIPQTFLISIINGSPTARIQKFQVNPGETLKLTLESSSFGEETVIVISGSSRYTRQDAEYQIRLIQQ